MDFKSVLVFIVVVIVLCFAFFGGTVGWGSMSSFRRIGIHLIMPIPSKESNPLFGTPFVMLGFHHHFQGKYKLFKKDSTVQFANGHQTH